MHPSSVPASASGSFVTPAPAALRLPAPLSFWSIVLRGSLVCLVVLLFVLGLLAWTFLPHGEVRELRRTALTQLGGSWHRQAEVRVGGLVLSAGQIAASLAGIPPEARAVLECVDSAEVSVNRRDPPAPHGSARRDDAAGLLAAATQAMDRRGWDPLVRVSSDGDTVAVFIAPTRDRDRVHLCVLVHDGDDLVIAACEGRLAPLLQLLNTDKFRSHLASW